MGQSSKGDWLGKHRSKGNWWDKHSSKGDFWNNHSSVSCYSLIIYDKWLFYLHLSLFLFTLKVQTSIGQLIINMGTCWN